MHVIVRLVGQRAHEKMRDVVEKLMNVDFSLVDTDLEVAEFAEYRDMVYRALPRLEQK